MAKVEEYQQMMAWLTRPKSKFQEPRIMDQAALSDDLEPGALKDEMLGNFDPSQETYEQYLQRINLERPFNMAEGGQLVAPSVDGSRPGYQGESGYHNVQRMKGSNTWFFQKGTGDNKIYKSGFDSPKAASDWGKKQKYKGPEVGEWERTEKYRKKVSKAQTIKLTPAEQKIYKEYLKVNPNAKEWISQLRLKIRDNSIGWDQIEKIKKRGGTFVGERFENPKYIKIVKAELNKIKKQKNNRNLFEFTEDSKWFKNLTKRLGMHSRTTQELLNHVIEQEFPGSYSGKWANSQFRNDIVVNDFIEYLKNHGEFDGYEKYGKATEQFVFPDKQTGRPRYDFINTSWKGWLAGDFEVPGIDRDELKAELKKRKIDWNEIKNWEPKDVRKKGLKIRAQLQFLNNLNNTKPNLEWQQVKNLYEKAAVKNKWDIGPNTFDNRITQLTQLKNSGVYAHSNGNTQSVPGIEKNREGRSPWLKSAFSQTFRTNYSILTNLGDRFMTKGDKLYNPVEGKRLHNAADNFFGPKGVFHKVSGEGEHALSRAFNLNNVDHQLKINSLVRGDLNQFKRLNFDTPVIKAYHEYNASDTTAKRRAELKFDIENRKKMMNALTGGETKGIVAKGNVNFKYGPKRITATSDVVPIDKLMEQGKFNVEDFVKRGEGYLKSFQEIAKGTGLLDESGQIIKQKIEPSKILNDFWCGKKQIAKADGGRIGFSGSCPIEVKQKNFIAFNNDVRTGKITGEAAEKIAKKTSDVVAKAGSRSALTKLLGPAGIGLDVIYEVASVGTDIYGGKPWKEAVQDNWIAGAFMPGTSQEEFHKSFFKKYPEAKVYGSGLDLEQAYLKQQQKIERLKADTTARGKADAARQLPQLERDLEGIVAQYYALGNAMQPGSPEYKNYMAAKTEYLDARKAKAPSTAAKLEMELNRPTSDRAVPYPKEKSLKIDFNLPGNYTTFKPDLPPQLGGTLPTTREIDELYTKEGYNLSPQDIDYVQKMEKWKQLFYDPENKGMGIRGTQDWRGAGGGIAGIRRPNAIPPKSGPNPQGLPSMYNRVKRI